jgi:hypothetical protein
VYDATTKILTRAGPLVAIAAALTLVLVPSASSRGGPQYTDPSGDNSSAADLSGVTVMGDQATGQITFRISGSNLSSAPNQVTFLVVDSDANPATGDPQWDGADYGFAVDDSGYDFVHWNGSDWVEAPYATVAVCCVHGGSTVTVSVNRRELGNASEFNFGVETVNTDTKAHDNAPDDGVYNYSLAAGGPDIQDVLVQTRPSFGPMAGKPFVIKPVGLKLPPSGALISIMRRPDSYRCRATISGRAVPGAGTGGCTLRIAKKARGKRLRLVLTVKYEGATKSVPFTFVVS